MWINGPFGAGKTPLVDECSTDSVCVADAVIR